MNYILWFVFYCVHLLVNIMNIRKCTVWDTQFAHAQQAKTIYNHTNTKEKLHTPIADIYFNKLYKIEVPGLAGWTGIHFNTLPADGTPVPKHVVHTLIHGSYHGSKFILPVDHIVWFVFNCILSNAFVGQFIEYKKMHGMSNIKMMFQRPMYILIMPARSSQGIMHCPCPHPRRIQGKEKYSYTHS
jgi:hypothetical protein